VYLKVRQSAEELVMSLGVRDIVRSVAKPAAPLSVGLHLRGHVGELWIEVAGRVEACEVSDLARLRGMKYATVLVTVMQVVSETAPCIANPYVGFAGMRVVQWAALYFATSGDWEFAKQRMGIGVVSQADISEQLAAPELAGKLTQLAVQVVEGLLRPQASLPAAF